MRSIGNTAISKYKGRTGIFTGVSRNLKKGKYMNLIDHLNVLVFACLYPIYVFFSYRKTKNDLVENKPGVRISDYKETIFWLWLLCIITIVIWVFCIKKGNHL